MRISRIARMLLAVLAVAVGAAVARAQDYTVTTHTVGSKMISVPSTATTAINANVDDSPGATVTLPFTFNYYGQSFTTVWLCSNGFAQFGSTTTAYSNSALPNSTVNGGLCAYWDDLYTLTNGVKYFTTGTAPDRVFVVNWNVRHLSSSTVAWDHQIQIHESGGRIIFSYGPGTYYTSSSATIGIDAPTTDSRYVVPTGISNGAFAGRPPNDYQFDPSISRFTGSLFLDAIVSDASGFGNSIIPGVPLAGLGVELRGSSGTALASATVASDGSYELQGLALPSSGGGSIHLVTSSSACRVLNSGGSPYSQVIVASVQFGADVASPPYTLNSSNDPGGAVRRAAQIAGTIGRANAYMRGRLGSSIPRVDVAFDDSSSLGTQFVPSSSSIRIGGTSSGNQDAYDTSIVMRAYGRFLVKTLSGASTTSTSMALDAKSDNVAALGDALGVYIHALMDGATQEFDATSTSSATVFDFESPFLTTPKGPDVGGWVVAAFYDLIDGTGNESHDTIDGTSDSDGIGGADSARPLDVFLALSSIDMTEFVFEWHDRGYDAVALSTNFIYHGVLTDDASESNDTFQAAASLGTIGAVRRGQYLSPFNEDWYRIEAPKTTGYIADVIYNRSLTDAVVLLQIRSPDGTLLATGQYDDAVGSLRAATGPIEAGTVYIRVAHVGGGLLGSYDFQAFGRIVVTSTGPTEWTVGQALSQPLVVSGGIPPYSFAVKPPVVLPAGLLLDSTNARVFGTPIQVGSTTYGVTTTDAGIVTNTFVANLSLKVNPELRFNAPPFNGLAVGKQTELSLGLSGGTAPITISDFVGDLPEGLTLGNDFVIRGTTNESKGGRVSFKATDVAGATFNFSTTLVACAKGASAKVALPFGSGESAAGLYVDAVSGSSASFTVTTAKKQPKRRLNVVVVGPDGNPVGGGLVKLAMGKVTIKNLPLPITGRYFAIVSGDGIGDSGAATELSGTAKVTLPKKGSGQVEFDFGEDSDFTLGALSGAQFTLQGTTTEGMAVRIVSLIRPDGSLFPADQIVEQQSKGKFTFKATLDQSGTWVVTVSPKPGPVGVMKYSYTLKQPKGGEYVVD